jgi:microcystin-dependent protein
MPSFVGMVAAFAMSSAPSGWLVCNGAEYAIADYGDLHTAITTTWGSLTDGSGGAGSTHFRVPDLSGAFLRGSGTQTYTNTYNGGSVGDKSVDTFKSHAHSVNYYSSGGGSNSPFGGSRFVATFTGNTNATGDTETKPFNVTILYCIKH